jgi:hypothetical protein
MKYLTLTILSLISLPIFAQNEPEEVVNVTLECYNTKTVFNDLKKTYKEVPIYGKASDQAGYNNDIMDQVQLKKLGQS